MGTTKNQHISLSSDDYATVLAMQEETRPMLRNLAARWHVEFEDLYQEAFLWIVTVYSMAMTKRNPMAYIMTHVRYRALDLLRCGHHADTLSLDAPLGDEEDLTLHDVLADHQADHDEGRDDRRAQALHNALRRLPLEDQQYLRRVHGLNGYDVLPLYPYSRNNPNKTESAARKHAYSQLRKDTCLVSEIFGQEVL